MHMPRTLACTCASVEARWLPPLQAAGWRDRSELVELAGNSLTTRARGTGAGGGDGDGADDVSQHARLLEGLLPPYAPIERGAVKVRARVILYTLTLSGRANPNPHFDTLTLTL